MLHAELNDPPSAVGRVVAEWSFEQPGDLQGWRPNAHVAGAEVEEGVLRCRGSGSDPILELQPMLNLLADSGQVIELRLKADRDGMAEIFWSDTHQGKYGGFSQEKSTRFQVRGDQSWQVYRILPFWHLDRHIVRLRLDLYDGAKFEIDFLRISQIQPDPVTETLAFDFRNGGQGWSMLSGEALGADSGGLVVPWSSSADCLFSPRVSVNAESNTWVAVTMATSVGNRATLCFATDTTRGMQPLTFPVRSDGKRHVYNIDMLSAAQWKGRVVALGLRPGNASSDRSDPSTTRRPLAQVSSIVVGEDPLGAAQLEVVSFALDDPLPRAGRKTTLKAVLTNRGGSAVTNLHAKLKLSPGMTVSSVSPLGAVIPKLEFDEEATMTWVIVARRPTSGQAELRVQSDGSDLIQTTAALSFSAPPKGARLDYVPEPKPVRGPYEIGAYYFPGWKSASQWHPITRFPERKPVLGWYAEGSPEIADWHIKWAVEHGITYFAYDWYWSRGSRQLEHALHDGLFKARYRHLVKFCLLWANHNAPGTSSRDDCQAVARHWIQNYFRRPEYLQIEGKPVVIIFSTDRLSADLGSVEVKKSLEVMREECRQAGLPGLYLMACVADGGQARQAASEGYDAVTAYTWPGLGIRDDSLVAPFESLLEGYRNHWRNIAEASPIPLGLPVCGGWDSRPWHGDNNLVRYGRTPALFQRHLSDAKTFLDSLPADAPLRKFLLIEAWNEWGEGAYIEPQAEFGFGYLDAIRNVFVSGTGKHTDYAPPDLGLGPYDVPPAEPARTAWGAGAGLVEWINTMDLDRVHVDAGVLSCVTTGTDPALFGPPMQAKAAEFKRVILRMRLQKPLASSVVEKAQLFWRTSRLPESEANSMHFGVQLDGQWHEYSVPVSDSRRWRGIVTRLRLDPCNQRDVTVQVQEIRLAE